MWAHYGEALQLVGNTCHAVLADLDVHIAVPVVELARCDPGAEIVRTDYQRTVHVRLSHEDAFQPPPAGANLLYGVCHEVGHLAIAMAVDGGPLPPIVWDEALAHTMAIDLFLPALQDRMGESFWPVPYPDFVANETASARANHEPGEWVSYSDLLERQTEQLREVVAPRDWHHTLRCVASVAATKPQAADWWWKFRGRMTR